MLDANAVGNQLLRQRDNHGRGPFDRLEIHHLRADVRMQANNLETGLAACLATELTGRLDRHAELVRLQAGGDVRMASRVHVRIDPYRNLRSRLPGAGDRIDAIQLTFGFDVDRLDAEIDCLHELGVRLAYAGEDDLRRYEAGAQGDVNLAPGIRVDRAAKTSQQADDRQRGVCLERVVQRVRI